MTCRDLIDFLDDYAEGRLDAEDRALFDRHLAVCTACVAFLQNYRESIRLARDAYGEDEAAIAAAVPTEIVDAIRRARLDG